MKDNIFIDTNIAIYALTDSSLKGTSALELLKLKPCISTQVVSESVNVCLKKFKFTKPDTYNRIDKLILLTELLLIQQSTLTLTFEVSMKYNFSYWDSLIIASALENDCNILYTEDLQHTQLIENKLRILNPFL